MTSVAELVHLEQVGARAGRLDARRVLLTLVTLLPFLLAWLVGRTARVVWVGFAWCVAAAVEGWSAGWNRGDAAASSGGD